MVVRKYTWKPKKLEVLDGYCLNVNKIVQDNSAWPERRGEVRQSFWGRYYGARIFTPNGKPTKEMGRIGVEELLPFVEFHCEFCDEKEEYDPTCSQCENGKESRFFHPDI